MATKKLKKEAHKDLEIVDMVDMGKQPVLPDEAYDTPKEERPEPKFYVKRRDLEELNAFLVVTMKAKNAGVLNMEKAFEALIARLNEYIKPE